MSKFELLMNSEVAKLERVENDEMRYNPLNGLIKEQAKEISSRFETYSDVLGSELEIVPEFDPDDDGEKIVPALMLRMFGMPTFNFTSTSFGQMASRVGMGGARFLKKSVEYGHGEEAIDLMNAWVRDTEKKEFLLRIYNDTQLRGFLSPMYTVFDHIDVIESMNEALPKDHDFIVDSYHMDPDSMELRLISPRPVMTETEEDATVGMIVKNGQIGNGSVSITFMVYTFACKNGLIVGPDNGVVYSRKHMNITRQEFKHDVAAVIEKFPNYVELAEESAKKAREYRISFENKEDLLDRVAREGRISEEDMEAIEKIFADKYNSNLLGLTSAITEVAQNKSAEQQYQMEQYAGTLIDRIA